MKDIQIKYTNEKSWTENWQKEYKYGVILFIPPEPIFSITKQLREKYDPISAKNCCPHISLTTPIKHPLNSDMLHSLEKHISTFDTFSINYGPVINFLPKAPGVVFQIQDQKYFSDLYHHIENTPDIQFTQRKWPFKAHLTIAEFLNEKETISLTEKLNNSIEPQMLKGQFMCKNVSYMVPNEDFKFEEVCRFSLKDR